MPVTECGVVAEGLLVYWCDFVFGSRVLARRLTYISRSGSGLVYVRCDSAWVGTGCTVLGVMACY